MVTLGSKCESLPSITRNNTAANHLLAIGEFEDTATTSMKSQSEPGPQSQHLGGWSKKFATSSRPAWAKELNLSSQKRLKEAAGTALLTNVFIQYQWTARSWALCSALAISTFYQLWSLWEQGSRPSLLLVSRGLPFLSLPSPFFLSSFETHCISQIDLELVEILLPQAGMTYFPGALKNKCPGTLVEE